MNRVDLFFVVVLGVAALGWILDTFIAADDLMEDENGRLRVQPSKYKGIVDYLKKTWYDKYKKKD